MKYKVLIVSDSTSLPMDYYRSVMPFQYLDCEYDVVKTSTEIDWSIVIQYNVLFMQRPSSQTAYSIWTTAKICGLKRWVDHDDMLWGVNSDSPAWEHYKDKEVQEYIKQFIVEADVVTVSTPRLKEELRKLTGVDAVVVRNAVVQKNDIPYKNYKKILWRGSETHRMDLLLEREELVNLLQANPEYKIIFFGMQPWFITPYIDNWIHAGFTDLTTYFEMMKRIEASFAYIPLGDTTFNHCKSDIAALEAINAGMLPVVTPGMTEFEQYIMKGCDTVSCTESLEWYMRQDSEDLESWFNELKDNLRMLEDENKVREAVLCGL